MGSDLGKKSRRKLELLELCAAFLAGCFCASVWRHQSSSSHCLVSFGKYRGKEYSIESTLHSKCLVESKFMKLQQHTVNMEGTVIDDWLWIDYHERVNVLVEKSPNEFLVFHQSKYALEERDSIAIIGGIIEPNEEPEKAAHREVLEETHLDCSNFVFLGRFRTDVNRGMGWTNTYIARECRESNQKLVDHADEVGAADTERQEMHTMSLGQVQEALRNGEFLEIQWSATVALAMLQYNGD